MKQHFETTFQKILHPKIWRKLPWERIWAPESGNFVTFIVKDKDKDKATMKIQG